MKDIHKPDAQSCACTVSAKSQDVGMKPKVIILNGSPKVHGNTAVALHEVEQSLQQQGIETEWLHVGHLQIHGCIACNKCWDTGVCAFHDIENELSQKMLEADGLLIDSFNHGQFVYGLAVANWNGQRVLILSDEQGVKAYQIIWK